MVLVEKTRYAFHYIAGLLLVALIITSISLKGDFRRSLGSKTKSDETVSDLRIEDATFFWANGCTMKDRNLHKDRNCSFMFEEYACEKYGRKDFKRKKWRWQPQHYDLPMFNGTAFLKKISGKKLFFVGDSLNKNQWTSMLCLIESSAPSLSSPNH